jgi:CHAT domain-containing protein
LSANILKKLKTINKLKWEREKGNARNIDNAIVNINRTLSKDQENLTTKLLLSGIPNQTVHTPSVDDIVKGLKNKECFIHYYLTENEVTMLVFTAGTKSSKIIPIRKDSLFDAAVSNVVEQFQSIGYANITTKDINKIYEFLIEPIKQLLENSEVERLIISPHKDLSFIPFDLLTNDKSDKRLIDDYIITMTPSWKTHIENQKQYGSWKDKSILLVADMDYNMVGSLRFIQEAEKIYKSNCRVAKKNIEANNYAALRSKNEDIWHLLVHGFSNPNNRYDNYLQIGTDTIFGYELFELESLPELLILSSCHTSWGKNEKGEGAYTFTRACIEAGVPHIISNLKLVNENIVNDVLTQFHYNLQSNDDIARALTNAKRTYIKKNISSYTDWAALVYWN